MSICAAAVKLATKRTPLKPSSFLIFSAWKLKDLCYAQTIPMSELQMLDNVSAPVYFFSLY